MSFSINKPTKPMLLSMHHNLLEEDIDIDTLIYIICTMVILSGKWRLLKDHIIVAKTMFQITTKDHLNTIHETF